MFLAGLFGILCVLPFIRGDTLSIKRGASFVHYIDIDVGELLTCTLKVDGADNISLFPNQLKNASTPLKSKLISLEDRACGFKLNNFGQYDPRKYDLAATVSYQGKTISYKKTLRLTVQEPREFKNKTILFTYGEETPFNDLCALPESGAGVCSLHAPNGDVVSEGRSCGYTLAHPTKEHVGAWQCKLYLHGNVEYTAYYIDLIPKSLPGIQTWYKKEGGYGIVGCRYVNENEVKEITTCAMITPENHMLNIEPFLSTGRYDSIGTNYTKNTCQIEFELPALQNETGTWTCKIGGITNWERGFINVEKASDYPKSVKVLSKLHGSPTITCEVPYPAVNSFVVNPEGQIYKKGTYADSQNGLLSFGISKINETDFGEWTCHFAKNNSYEDELITVNIESYDLIKPKVKLIDVVEGEELVILFTANSAIAYCIIEDPKGNTYHILPSTKSDFIEYYGKGFDHGECGIKLKRVTRSSEGMWKCMSGTSGQTPDAPPSIVATRVDVRSQEEAGLATASSSAIWIGIVFAVLVATALVIFGKYRKERKQRISPANSMGDENSETSFVLNHL